jgi:hypothetical protein
MLRESSRFVMSSQPVYGAPEESRGVSQMVRWGSSPRVADRVTEFCLGRSMGIACGASSRRGCRWLGSIEDTHCKVILP